MNVHRIAEEVKGFAIANNEIYWSSENQLLKLEDGETKTILISKERLQEVKFETPYLFVPDFHGNSYIFQTKPNYHPNLFIKKVISEDKVIVSHDKLTKLYNPIKNELKDLINYRIFHFYQHQDYLITQHDKNIIAYSIDSGSTIWNKSINNLLGTYTDNTGNRKEYKVTKFICINNNDLLVQFTNSILISMNIETGTLSYKLNLKEKAPVPASVFYDDYCHPSIVDGKLIWLNNQRLMKIDINNGAVNVVKDYFNEPKDEQYRFMKNISYNDKILFVADKGWKNVTPSIIGIMDSNNGNIMWEHQLINTGGLPEEPQVNNNIMFIRTANKTLYSIDIEEQIN